MAEQFTQLDILTDAERAAIEQPGLKQRAKTLRKGASQLNEVVSGLELGAQPAHVVTQAFASANQ